MQIEKSVQSNKTRQIFASCQKWFHLKASKYTFTSHQSAGVQYKDVTVQLSVQIQLKVVKHSVLMSVDLVIGHIKAISNILIYIFLWVLIVRLSFLADFDLKQLFLPPDLSCTRHCWTQDEQFLNKGLKLTHYSMHSSSYITHNATQLLTYQSEISLERWAVNTCIKKNHNP